MLSDWPFGGISALGVTAGFLSRLTNYGLHVGHIRQRHLRPWGDFSLRQIKRENGGRRSCSSPCCVSLKASAARERMGSISAGTIALGGVKERRCSTKVRF